MNEVLKKEVLKIFHRFQGIIDETNEKITLTNSNAFGNKIVECECSVGLLKSEKYPYAVDVCEKTYCIKGGRGYPCENIDEVKKNLLESLRDFNFIEERQMSLFDDF